MPELPPDLYTEVITLCEPHFRTDSERDAELLPILSTWEGFGTIDWSGSRRAFTTRLAYLLPPAQLTAVLRGLNRSSGAEQLAHIADICRRIEISQGLIDPAQSRDLFGDYYQQIVATWSAPRYQIDRRFVQLTLLLDKGPDEMGLRFVQDARHGRYDDLAQLLAETDEQTLVLLGAPGSGKSTLLRRLQLEMAWQQLADPTGQVVFFVSLNSYRTAAGQSAPPAPLAWLESRWQQRTSGLPPFATLFEQGHVVLLLDGLNEIPHRNKADYRARIGQWRDFLQTTVASGNRVLFSCRSLDYSAPLGSSTVAVRQVQVESLTPPQIEAFLQVYLGESYAPVWEVVRSDSQQLELFASPFFLRLLVDQVAETGAIPRGQVALLTGAVRRALYREVQLRQHRLFQPGGVLDARDYERVFQDRWGDDPYALPERGVLIPKLMQLAYRMQDNRGATEGGQVRVAEQTAHALLVEDDDTLNPEDVVAAGVQLNVLEHDTTADEIAFYHQLIQEYFAARVLAAHPEPQRIVTAWRADAVEPAFDDLLQQLAVSEALPALPATGWEETTVLAAAMTADPERFVSDVMAVNLPLAGRCAAAPEVRISESLRTRIQQALLVRSGAAEADLRARIRAAEVLGELGDPRFERHAGSHGDYLLPPTRPIAGGTYRIGDDGSQYEFEKPAHAVAIDSFELALFPVTNAEYALFMAAGGYADERWWQTDAARAWLRGEGSSAAQKADWQERIIKPLQRMSEDQIRAIPNMTPEQIDGFLEVKRMDSAEIDQLLDEWFPEGETYHQPEFWDDSRFNHPSQPVVGITWFEANAYCAWLSTQTDRVWTLPTEAEWEAAAGGARDTDGRVFAYGDRYDAAHCNTFETHIRRTTPVGVFPHGMTPEGIADLSGNIWEWTNTQFRPYPYAAHDGREEMDAAEGHRTLRGGSWNDNSSYARVTSRDPYLPLNRLNFFGFRCLVRRPPSHLDP